nr:uncharacterized protein LOC118971633 [Manis javanica]
MAGQKACACALRELGLHSQRATGRQARGQHPTGSVGIGRSTTFFPWTTFPRSPSDSSQLLARSLSPPELVRLSHWLGELCKSRGRRLSRETGGLPCAVGGWGRVRAGSRAQLQPDAILPIASAPELHFPERAASPCPPHSGGAGSEQSCHWTQLVACVLFHPARFELHLLSEWAEEELHGQVLVTGRCQTNYPEWREGQSGHFLSISCPDQPEALKHPLPTWDDCQQLLQVLFTTEERERIQVEARTSLLGDNRQPTQNPELINTAFPLSRPNWDYNSAEGKERLQVYRQTLLAGLRAAARKPTNLAKVYNVQQGRDESPAAFLERIIEAFRQYTPMDPEAPENRAAIVMAFINQATQDIEKKLQRVERLGERSLQDLVVVAERVFNNRKSPEELQTRINDHQI